MSLFEIIFWCFAAILWIASDIFNIYSVIHNKAYREDSPIIGSNAAIFIFAIITGPFCFGYTFKLFDSKK